VNELNLTPHLTYFRSFWSSVATFSGKTGNGEFKENGEKVGGICLAGKFLYYPSNYTQLFSLFGRGKLQLQP